MRSYLSVVLVALLLILAIPARAQDKLIFCNTPERLTTPGIYASAVLEPSQTYTIFYHYYNVSGRSGDLYLGFQGEEGSPLTIRIRQGTADPRRDPSLAGRQAMMRFMGAAEKEIIGSEGYARFRYVVGNRQVASGMLTITPRQKVTFQAYFRHALWTVKGAQAVVVDAPRYDVEIPLTADMARQSYRIGVPEGTPHPHFDGTYGFLYSFKIAAPEGSRVRVAFSPRGGKGGVVGSVNGAVVTSNIVEAGQWKMLCETTVGPNGTILTTAPFGGVFYPVELVFQLM
jgi:hypothetical protein